MRPHPNALRVARRASALATVGVAAALLVAAFAVPSDSAWRWTLLAGSSTAVLVVLAVAAVLLGATSVAVAAALDLVWLGIRAAVVLGIDTAVLASGRGRVALSRDGRVDWSSGILVDRRRTFDVASVLHVESVQRGRSDRLPVHAVSVVVADRGARRLTIRWLTLADALAVAQRMTRDPRFATYRSVAHRP